MVSPGAPDFLGIRRQAVMLKDRILRRSVLTPLEYSKEPHPAGEGMYRFVESQSSYEKCFGPTDYGGLSLAVPGKAVILNSDRPPVRSWGRFAC